MNAMCQHLLIFSIFPTLIYSTYDDYNVIDLSDILNVDYMPGSLLLLENPENFDNTTTISNVPEYHGNFQDALTTMNYHRKMMNEYLCRSYVSEQILSEMKSTRMRRRLGSAVENVNTKIGTSPLMQSNVSFRNNMIDDEGSVNYQEWLKKSATLEDIYRHYDAQNKDAADHRDSGDDSEDYDSHVTGYAFQHGQNQGLGSKFSPSGGGGGGYPSYGYGGGHGHSGAGGIGNGGLFGVHSGSHGDYGGSGPIFGGAEHIYSEGVSGHGGHGHGSYHEHSPKHHGGHDKDKLADLFDIALTALAFLSFGMFIVQVIMCISMGTATTTPMTVMPLSVGGDTGGIKRGVVMGGGSYDGGGTDSASEDAEEHTEKSHAGGSVTILGEDDYDRTEEGEDVGEGFIRIGRGPGARAISNINLESSSSGLEATADDTTGGESASADADVRDGSKLRGKRQIPVISQPNNELLNDLARRVLISIEAALVAHQDDGSCLRRALCENNVHSRLLDSNQRYWVPVWSLGMSWLSGRLIPQIPSTTSMLDSLKASILGLGRADCEFLYRCDLNNEREKRLRRRRKRRSAKEL